jgi:rod shape-determining protein MreD
VIPVRARIGLVVVAAVLLQVAALARIRPMGVVPDLMVLVAIGAGMIGGPERGAVVGFAAGLAFDLFLETPLALSALVFSITGYAVGLIGQAIVRASRWIPIVTAAAASALAEVLFAVTGSVVGQPGLLEPRLALVAVVVAIANLALAPLVMWASAWALSEESVRPR